MEIKTLMYFLQIAETKSMRKAAEKLYVTQPNLTRAMQNLEEEMGAPLLVRTNRGVTLTNVGESLYYYAQSIINQFSEIEQLKAQDQEYEQSEIKFSVGNLILKDEIALDFYNAIRSKHTNISMHETTTERVLQHVASLESEIGVVVINECQLAVFKKIMDIRGLEMHEMDRGPLCVHVGPKNPMYNREEILAEELLPYTRVQLPYDYFSNFSSHMKIGSITVEDFRKTITINNYHSVINLLKRTEVFILGNVWQVEELNKGNIHSLRICDYEEPRILVWIKRKKEILSEQAEEFLKMLNENYPKSKQETKQTSDK